MRCQGELQQEVQEVQCASEIAIACLESELTAVKMRRDLADEEGKAQQTVLEARGPSLGEGSMFQFSPNSHPISHPICTYVPYSSEP